MGRADSALAATGRIGRDLRRPESVLHTRSGDFYVSHRGRGVARLRPDGTQYLLSGAIEIGGAEVVPNGIALGADGTFVVANIGDGGGILRLDEHGLAPWIDEIDGRPTPPINFVTFDASGRLWFSVSSTLSPRHLAYRRDVKNGYVGVVEDGHARVVLDGLHYTNEIRPELADGWLYVSETFGHVVSRFPLAPDGRVERTGETAARFPDGAFVDGIALDVDGGLWAACIVSNELFHVPPGGEPRVHVGERDGAWVDEVLGALDAGTMGREHFDRSPGRTLRNVSSIAFHGPELDRLACGNLLGDALVDVPVPVRGRAPVHFDVEVPLWGEPF